VSADGVSTLDWWTRDLPPRLVRQELYDEVLVARRQGRRCEGKTNQYTGRLRIVATETLILYLCSAVT
jgi:hypothetical protein